MDRTYDSNTASVVAAREWPAQQTDAVRLARGGKRELLLLLVQLCLAGVVLYSAIGKLVSGYAIVGIVLSNSGLLPDTWRSPLHTSMPYLELGWGVVLLTSTGKWRRRVLWASSVLITLMTAVLVTAGIRSGWGQGCGCAGMLTQADVAQTSIRNGILLLITLFGVFLAAGSKPLGASLKSPI